MSMGGSAVAFPTSNNSFPDLPYNIMLPSARLLYPPPMPLHALNPFISPLSLAPPTVAEMKHDLSPTADSEAVLKPKEEDFDAKSNSSDNVGSAGDDQEAADKQGPKRRRFHRHTQLQIQEMERVFKECPHPDEKQRQELSRELGLDPMQVKFWFQNKRTQMKNQHERHDNSILRNENEKLKAENFALRDAINNVSCPTCGGPANLAEMSFDEQQLRIENVKLREQITRVSTIAAKYVGRYIPSVVSSFASPSLSSSDDAAYSVTPTSVICNDLVSGPSVADIAAQPVCFTEAEKPMLVELAVASVEELIQVAKAGEPLWILDAHTGFEIIDMDQYLQRFPRGIGPTPFGLKPETTRHAGIVIASPNLLVEALMDVNRWMDMFSCIISRAFTIQVLSTGVAGTYDGAIQLMYSEFQVPTPLIPTRENCFLRYSKHVENAWVVVDVSIDSLRVNPPTALLKCRRRPSGCVIEEVPNGCSKVTWVEHVEVEGKGIHAMYQPYINSGFAFGAQRWVATMRRQCDKIATLAVANSLPSSVAGDILTPGGRNSMLKLAERMSNDFCGGVSASTSSSSWTTLSGMMADDVRVVIRSKSIDDPGKPPGIILNAATSLWLPVSSSRVFAYLQDRRTRPEWDILSNMAVVEEVVHIAKGPDNGNGVSLLRVNGIGSNQNNMLILQECCTDESCSMVIYAPVDASSVSSVLGGGDPGAVSLLPSGFAILPDGRSLGVPTSGMGSRICGGSLLTVAFQILVDSVPPARLSLTSIATSVNNLVASTVLRIKNALNCQTV